MVLPSTDTLVMRVGIAWLLDKTSAVAFQMLSFAMRIDIDPRGPWSVWYVPSHSPTKLIVALSPPAAGFDVGDWAYADTLASSAATVMAAIL
jgi:hypothetical protein